VKFRSERDTLAEVLATAGRAAGGRGGTSPVLSGLLLRTQGNRLEATGTDLDLTIRVEHEVIGIDDGSCVVPARLVADVVRSLEPGAVTVELDEKPGESDYRVEISSARARFTLRSFPVVEWPSLPAVPAPTMGLPRPAFAEALRQVVRAASNDDARPLLTGVLLTSDGKAVRLVATDSYRLALRDLQGVGASGEGAFTEGGDVLVPARALAEVQRLASSSAGAGASVPRAAAGLRSVGEGDTGGEAARASDSTPGEGAPGAEGTEGGEIGISAGQTEITFVCGPVRVSTRLLDGTYPDYRQLLPEHYPNRLHVGRDTFLAALRRVRLLVRDNTTPVRLTMRANGVDLTVVSQEVGDASESVDGDFTGEELVIAFNPTYLIEGVEAVLDDEVFIETDTPSKPATVRAAGRDDFRYLLMPVRVP
jgi:DNA polymerase-3 subunit beta